MKKVIISFVCAIFLFVSSNVKADEIADAPIPFEKIGLGVKLDKTAIGANMAWAIQKHFHIGATLGTSHITGDAGGTLLYINPFFRYLFNNEGNLFPFAEFNFAFSDIPKLEALDPSGNASTSSSTANFEIGGMWFPLSTVSIGAGINIINYNIDAEALGFGLGRASLFMNWWL